MIKQGFVVSRCGNIPTVMRHRQLVIHFYADRGAAGRVGDGAWELSWEPRLRPYELVHPLVRRTGIARTELVLAHADLVISGTLDLGGRRLDLDGARGGQAHLWGTRHAERWAWTHASDVHAADGTPLCMLDDLRGEPHAWVKLWKHHAAQPEADRINAVAAERRERGHEGPGLVAPAPAAARIGEAGERIHDGVEIG